jgi:hypothetical protein
MRYAEKCGTTRQATDGKVVWRMRIAFGITKATDTHSEYLILTAFYNNKSFENAPPCYIYTALPLSF